MSVDSSWLVVLALLAVALGTIGWRIGRERELFRIRCERGKLLRVRGRIPASLLSELGDVLGRARATCVVIGCRSDGAAALRVRGEADAAVVQQLRNVLGRFPLAKIVSAPPRTAGR